MARKQKRTEVGVSRLRQIADWTAEKIRSVARLARLFQGFAGAHGTHGEPNRDGQKWIIKKTAKSLREPVTDTLWQQHVSGDRPLGPIPIREDSTCSWGSIDYDEYDTDIVEIIRSVEAHKLPLVPCRSKSGGLHLFLFLDRAYPAEEVQSALRDAAALLGMAESEIFPKQTKVFVERGDIPNWIIAPYFGGNYDGKLKWQHGLKRTGADMSLEEFVAFAESRRTDLESFVAVSESKRANTALNGVGGKKEKRSKGTSPCDFSDGPPCIQFLISNGVQTDYRKRSLFHAGIYYKKASEDWRTLVERHNSQYFSPPLPTSEVQQTIDSLGKKDYQYTCKEEPMRSHCNSTLCRSRRLGVGIGGALPEIAGMRCVETDPPLWLVDIRGKTLELTTDDLLNYRRFLKIAIDRIHVVFMPMKDAEWLGAIGAAMQEAESIPAPPDVSETGKLFELLEEYLTNRAQGDSKKDLFAHMPYLDSENRRYYFTLTGFEKFLQQERVKIDFHRNKFSQRIREMGGGQEDYNPENKRNVSTWWIPAKKVQTPVPLDVPRLPEEKI